MNKIVSLASQVYKDIDNMTELLYQEKVTEGYAKLNSVVTQMDQLINSIVAYQSQTNEKIIDEVKLLGSVEEAFQAMESQDIVLLADIFSYDIKEQLECLVQA